MEATGIFKTDWYSVSEHGTPKEVGLYLCLLSTGVTIPVFFDSDGAWHYKRPDLIKFWSQIS